MSAGIRQSTHAADPLRRVGVTAAPTTMRVEPEAPYWWPMQPPQVGGLGAAAVKGRSCAPAISRRVPSSGPLMIQSVHVPSAMQTKRNTNDQNTHDRCRHHHTTADPTPLRGNCCETRPRGRSNRTPESWRSIRIVFSHHMTLVAFPLDGPLLAGPTIRSLRRVVGPSALVTSACGRPHEAVGAIRSGGEKF